MATRIQSSVLRTFVIGCTAAGTVLGSMTVGADSAVAKVRDNELRFEYNVPADSKFTPYHIEGIFAMNNTWDNHREAWNKFNKVTGCPRKRVGVVTHGQANTDGSDKIREFNKPGYSGGSFNCIAPRDVTFKRSYGSDGQTVIDTMHVKAGRSGSTTIADIWQYTSDLLNVKAKQNGVDCDEQGAGQHCFAASPAINTHIDSIKKHDGMVNGFPTKMNFFVGNDVYFRIRPKTEAFDRDRSIHVECPNVIVGQQGIGKVDPGWKLKLFKDVGHLAWSMFSAVNATDFEKHEAANVRVRHGWFNLAKHTAQTLLQFASHENTWWVGQVIDDTSQDLPPFVLEGAEAAKITNTADHKDMLGISCHQVQRAAGNPNRWVRGGGGRYILWLKAPRDSSGSKNYTLEGYMQPVASNYPSFAGGDTESVAADPAE